MDGDLEQRAEEGKIDMPESIGPISLGEESLSMRAQKDNFIGGTSEKRAKSKEDAAMEKVEKLRESKNLLSHASNLDWVREILKEGILSQNFRKRARKITTSPSWGSQTWWAEGFKIYGTATKMPVDNGKIRYFAVVINKPADAVDDGSGRSFINIPHRVASREFLALIIPDKNLVEMSDNRKQVHNPKDLALEEARKIAEENFTPENALPIYGTSGDLLWPQQIPAEELGTKPQASKT